MNDYVPQNPPPILNPDNRINIDIACYKCGHNLKSLSPTARCPQCHNSVSTSLNRTLDDQTRLIRETPCLKCGYNLYMQPYHADCPECGAPVKFAVRGDLLQYADFKWLRKIKIGMNLLIYGFICFLAVFTTFLIVMTLDYYTGRYGFDTQGIARQAFWAVFRCALILSLIGACLATSPDKTSLSRTGMAERRFARNCILVSCASALILLVPYFAAFPRLCEFTGVLSIIAGVVAPLALLLHISALLKRVPDKFHAVAAKVAGVCYSLLWLLIIFLILSSRRGIGVQELFLMLLAIALCVSMLWIFDRTRKLFRHAAQQARENTVL